MQRISDVRLNAPIDTMLPRGLLNMEECRNQQLDFNEMACDEVAFTAYRPDDLISILNLSSETITAAYSSRETQGSATVTAGAVCVHCMLTQEYSWAP